MPSILFKCKGNICRSPAAELLLRYYRPDWHIFSVATTPNTIGETMHPRMIFEFKKRGYPISNLPREVYYQDWIIEQMGDFDQIHDLHAEGIQDPYITGNFSAAFIEIDQYIKNVVIASIED